MGPRAVILGLEGSRLSANEAAFFRDADPWAFILFARNIETPAQMRRLCADLRASVGRDALIFIDQEGGRVQRMGPPHWPKYPAASRFAALGQDAPRAAYLGARLIAHDLRDVGVTANCAPVLDIPVADADPIISDRAYGDTPEGVIALAHAVMAGYMSGGVAPVIKHIPGHGRATVDSHKALPLIETDLATLKKTDFVPFKALNMAPMAMTAHVTLAAIDSAAPLTLSPDGMSQIVRGALGYDGLIMTDDLEMKALSGSLTKLSSRALSAGCDIALHCSGNMANMVKVVSGVSRLRGKSLERACIADLSAYKPDAFDVESGRAEFNRLMGGAA
ncbi:beta-N-acetylhexosaminidase [Robiginitomaculum antarcticum]|uniref:beta-N-acetylhexosaminidase n=1 Tax=Robiginitomaculum antarcticum TaxID=437507 RepID=UPI0003787BC9